jgi:hypothetical protein
MSSADLDSPDREREEGVTSSGIPPVEAVTADEPTGPSQSQLATKGTLIGIPAPLSPRELLQLAKARLREDGVPPNVTQLGRKRTWEVRQDSFNDTRVNAIEATVRTLPSAPALGAVWQEGQAVLRARRARGSSPFVELEDAASEAVADVARSGRGHRQGSTIARLVAGAAAGVFMAVVAVAAFHTKSQDGDGDAWRPKSTVQGSRGIEQPGLEQSAAKNAAPSAMGIDPVAGPAASGTSGSRLSVGDKASPEQGAAVRPEVAGSQTESLLPGRLRESSSEEERLRASARPDVAGNSSETREAAKNGAASADIAKGAEVSHARKDLNGDDELSRPRTAEARAAATRTTARTPDLRNTMAGASAFEPRPFQPSQDSGPGRNNVISAAASGVNRSESINPSSINSSSFAPSSAPSSNAPSPNGSSANGAWGARPGNEGSMASPPPSSGRSRADNRSNADPDAILPLSLD